VPGSIGKAQTLPQKVSVIIATHNRAQLVGEAIRSVRAQTYPHVEIIVADDGSTDETAGVVAGYGEAITFVSRPHTGQPAITRNLGLREASGELIAFLDSDDQFLPDKLTLQVAAFAENPEAGCVYSNGRFFRNDPAQSCGHVLDGMPTTSGDVLDALLRGNFLASPVLLLRRTCLDKVGTFDEDPSLGVAEDYELWLRVAAHFPFVYIEGDVAAIRRQKGSISSDVALLRGCSLLALEKLLQHCPDVRTSRATALHEGYARNHGAIAVALWKERKLLPAARHALKALRSSVRTPGLGTVALREWIKRRRVRGTGARP
jgi:glycosyltransferase involved in cell wall biosynthesis